MLSTNEDNMVQWLIYPKICARQSLLKIVNEVKKNHEATAEDLKESLSWSTLTLFMGKPCGKH